MFRTVLLSALVAYLIAVGLWPAALAPVHLAALGAAALIGAIPGPALLLAGIAVWLKYRTAQPTPRTATA